MSVSFFWSTFCDTVLNTVKPLSHGIEETQNFSRKKEVNLKAFLIEGTKNLSRKKEVRL
jgi:hypothetical protein